MPVLRVHADDMRDTMNVLFVSPHPDDFTLQNGIALLHHIKKGDMVHIIIVSESEHLERNKMMSDEASAILGLIDFNSFTRLGI